MNAIKKIGTIILLVCWHVLSHAQTDAMARLDTNSLLIGDQTVLELSFSCPADYTVHWPMINDTIIKEIEVVKHSKLESIPGENKRSMLYRQSYTITSFDSGFYAIPPILIGYKTPGDTTLKFDETDALLLEVNSIPVSMEADIKDIKEPMRAPFTFREALPFILIFLGLLLAGFLGWYYIRKRKKAEPIFKAPPARKIPADQAALEALEALRFRKLWQQGEIKQYHTELTDIIREYLWSNFNIHAHEFTTEEIMAAVINTKANAQAREKLHQALVLADMVKFAKMQPLPVEHDGSLNNAIDFIKETRHLNKQVDAGGPEPPTFPVITEADTTKESVNDAVVSEKGKEAGDVE